MSKLAITVWFLNYWPIWLLYVCRVVLMTVKTLWY